MQLVKVLKGGVDVDGDGTDDLSSSRIYYAGQSFGGIYGTQLLGLEPDIRAGVPNVPGGRSSRSRGSRRASGSSSASRCCRRTPPLYNAIPNAGFDNFHENIPLGTPAGRRVPGRDGDPAADRPDGVGHAAREPRGLRAVRDGTR